MLTPELAPSWATEAGTVAFSSQEFARKLQAIQIVSSAQSCWQPAALSELTVL